MSVGVALTASNETGGLCGVLSCNLLCFLVFRKGVLVQELIRFFTGPDGEYFFQITSREKPRRRGV